ncbi:DUF2510 domain-containing protein [Agromyces archimandritae]|uniref:DUF2510 domain-containing protein n=1 Tax=Agromyces archimandritae TaxID=2781962 RepID=A0A975IMY8_9MICO|nr:DUF2510 domain-containing protein [Agromyces archimandritae]QTX03980.1 DUF2510 domain-containing protein [Agromyces archimandritae]
MTSNAPAGWYDDGGGRTRYWDGAAWTDRFVDDPGQASVATAAEAPAKAGSPMLGLIGLGLAVVALVGVALPWMLVELIGGVLLIAAFAVTIVAFSRRGPRWPAIAAIIVCVAAVVVAAVMFVIGFMAGYAGAVSG